METICKSPKIAFGSIDFPAEPRVDWCLEAMEEHPFVCLDDFPLPVLFAALVVKKCLAV